MKRIKFIAAAAVFLLCGCTEEKTADLAPYEAVTEISVTETDAENIIISSEMLECRYYNENDFLMYDKRGEAYSAEGNILCGVVPHHLTAGHMISGFFKAAAESRPDAETVVIIAPMHYPSDNMLCTSETDWASPFGISETDNEITALFKDKLGAADDDEMIQYDHSASAHIPFVKHYFPEAKTACLLVSPREAGDIPERLAEVLSEAAEMKSCLFVFSIDFSHYLPPEKADMHDIETLEAVLNGDVAEIERMNNNNVDSPYCLSAYVRLTAALGGNVTAADNSNTARIREVPYNGSLYPEGVTSYFVYISS